MVSQSIRGPERCAARSALQLRSPSRGGEARSSPPALLPWRIGRFAWAPTAALLVVLTLLNPRLLYAQPPVRSELPNSKSSPDSTGGLDGTLSRGTPSQDASSQGITAFQAALAMQQVLVDAIAKAERSVVAIARVRKTSGNAAGVNPRDLGALPVDPQSPEFVPNEFATGVVIDREGLILTNYHVLGNPDENDYYVWINRRPFKAEAPWVLEKIVAGDPWSDLAILKIKANDLEPMPLGDAGKLRKGMIVLALGNPYAIARDGQVSASWGIISNLSRKAAPRTASAAQATGAQATGAETLHEFGTLIQTDAKLNLGTSGGALIDLQGRMIGLTTSMAALAGYDKAAGFAIPVDEMFLRTVQRLKAGLKAEYGFLGVAPRNLGLAQRQAGRFGAEVVEVIKGTPAHTASLRPGDVITHVDGQAVYDRDNLFLSLSRLPMGAQVKLAIRRDDQRLVKTVKLAKKYVEFAGPAIGSEPEPSWRGMRVEYATALPPSLPRPARTIDASRCVGVLSVEKDSPAWIAGIQPGEFIDRVGDRAVTSPTEFYTAVMRQRGDVRLRLAEGGTDGIRIVKP